MIRTLILSIFTLACFSLFGQTYRTSSYKFYTEDSRGKSSLSDSRNTNVKIVIDTISQKVTVTSVGGPSEYKITAKLKPYISKDGTYHRSFNVSQHDRLTGRLSVSISPSKTSLSFRMNAMVGGREMCMGRHVYEASNKQNSYSTSYMSTYFHDILEETPLESHSCNFSIVDSEMGKVLFVNDLTSGSESRMLLIISEDGISETDDYISEHYTCNGSNLPDETFTIVIDKPKNPDKGTYISLTHNVGNKPVYTKKFMSDYITN